MTQIELDALNVVCKTLPELIKQLKLQNKIEIAQLRLANGGFLEREELDELKKQLAD